MTDLILQVLQQRDFVDSVCVFDCPACRPDLFPVENVTHDEEENRKTLTTDR